MLYLCKEFDTHNTSNTMNSFRHSSNTRNSINILKLRKIHGAAGYGVYIMLLEFLCSSPDGTAPRDYETLSYHLDVPAELIQTVVEDFDLFILYDNNFTHSVFMPKAKEIHEEPETLVDKPAEPVSTELLDEQLEKVSDKDSWIDDASRRTGYTFGKVQFLLHTDFRNYCIKNKIVPPVEPEELFNAFYEWLPPKAI